MRKFDKTLFQVLLVHLLIYVVLSSGHKCLSRTTPIRIVYSPKGIDWHSPFIDPGKDLQNCQGFQFLNNLTCAMVLNDDPEHSKHLPLADAVVVWPGYNLEMLENLEPLRTKYRHPTALNEPPLLYMIAGEALHNSHLFADGPHREIWIDSLKKSNSDFIVIYGLVPHTDSHHLRYWPRRQWSPEHHTPLSERIPRILFISSRAVPMRTNLLDKLLKAGIPIDSVSHTNRNLPVVGACNNNKSCMQKQYLFCLAIENSYLPGYHTEKLYDALADGCIPLYYGHPDVVFSIPSESSIIRLDEYLDRLPVLKDLINKIIADPDLAHTYQTWHHVHAPWASHEIDESVAACVLCQHVINRILEDNENGRCRIGFN